MVRLLCSSFNSIHVASACIIIVIFFFFFISLLGSSPGVHRRSRAGRCHEGQRGVLDHQGLYHHDANHVPHVPLFSKWKCRVEFGKQLFLPGRVRGEGAGVPGQAGTEQRLIRLKFFHFDILTSDVFQRCPLDQLVPTNLRCGHYCVYGQIKSTTHLDNFNNAFTVDNFSRNQICDVNSLRILKR